MGGLMATLRTCAAVDEHLCDQLILPASLAKGRSCMLAGVLSLHTQTAIEIAKIMVPEVRIHVEKQGGLNLVVIDGVGYCKGNNNLGVAPPRAHEEVKDLPEGCLPRASQQMLNDFGADMVQLSHVMGIHVSVDADRDRLLIQGAPDRRTNAAMELNKVLAF